MAEKRPLVTYIVAQPLLHGEMGENDNLPRQYAVGDEFRHTNQELIDRLRAEGVLKLPEEMKAPATLAEERIALEDENAALRARLAELEAAAIAARKASSKKAE